MAYVTHLTDSFNRTAGNLNGSTLDNANGGSDSATWTDKVGTWLLTGTEMQTPAGGADYITTTSAAGVSTNVKVSFKFVARTLGVIARWTTGSGVGNFYAFVIGISGTDTRLYKSVGGAFTLLATGTTTVVATDICTLEVTGANPSIVVTAYVNGVQEIQVTGQTDHDSGQVGFYGGAPQTTLDNFKYELDAGGGASAVPVFMNQYRQRRA